MPDCPKCRSALARRKNDFGVFWYCEGCEGSAVTMSLLRKMVPSSAMNGLWQRARMGSHPKKHRCPGCNRKMEEISVDAEGQTRAIDVCSSCQFVWLDEGEWADLAFFAVERATPEAMREAVRARIAQKREERNSPPAQERVILPPELQTRPQPPQLNRPKLVPPPKIVMPEPSPPSIHRNERIKRSKPVEKSSLRSERRDSGESKRRAAQRRLDESKRQARLVQSRRVRAPESKRKSGWGEGPTAAWQWIPALLGMPVEDEQPLGSRQDTEKPWFTWIMAGGVALISLLAMLDLRTIVDAYGLVPAEFGRMGGLTWITAFFLHAGLLHLVGNVYFLVIFGDNVEKCLGTLEFFLLLCLATVSGHFVHILLDPTSVVPCIGASGGISGVMAFYALRFRGNQLAVMFWFIVKTYWLRMSAILMFGIWVVLQFVVAGQQVAGISNVSGGAHLGGALAGAFVWLVWRLSQGKRYVSEGGFAR